MTKAKERVSRNVPPDPWGGEVLVFPATIAQQGFWYLDRLEPGNPAYNIAVRFRLEGPLRSDVLERALNAIVARHESLRTVFAEKDGQPVQVVAPSLAVRLSLTDLRSLPSGNRYTRSEAITVEEARRRFDLTAGPLIRFGLVRLKDEDHVLLVTVHHIISDGWSIGVITEELGALYGAFCRDLGSPLPDLPLQNGDYAVWQEQWLEKSDMRQSLSYWTSHLSGLPPFEIRTDRPRPAVRTANGEIESILLPVALTDTLRGLSERQGCTFFMLALTALKTLLSRYSGQTDIYVGTLAAGRERIELEPMIGPFINPLVLRTDLSGDPTFSQLLGRVQETVTEALSNQAVPFERVVEAIQPKRDSSRHPVFQINFIYQRDFVRPVHASGITLTAIPSRSPGAIYDLNFFMVERSEGWRASCEYNTDLYDAATIRRILGCFQTLLTGIAADPDRRVSDLPVLSPAERRQLLVEWNDTAASSSPEACFHDLFESQVGRTPDAIAVESEGRTLSYRELDASANQLAHHLRRLGVGPEVVVGICVERSPEMVVGLLGILKAGGAYLPLDPQYPRERLSFLIGDAGPPVILTQAHLAPRLPDVETEWVYLDARWDAIVRESRLAPASGAMPDNLAYVIYTSGTTGQPKGVLIEHRGLSNYLTWAVREYEVAAGCGAPVYSSISFDLTITALFTPLLAGRRVDLLGGGPGVETLSAAFRRASNYSLVKITPAHLQLLGEQISKGEAVGRTRTFVVGGEQLTGEQIAFRRENSPETQIVNEYGPTETVVGCCVYRVAPDDRFHGGSVPIGRPIGRTRLYVLDQHLDPVPDGVVGELFIGGAGVARGYLNRPELTAEAFIPDPFGNEPGARLYRTGDLCRRRSDGCLEFLGRADRQLKVRGFRVEPGEIEAVLAQHPMVRVATVIASDDEPSGLRLIAYIVPSSVSDADGPELRRWLKQRLPEHMVPSAVVVLDSMPLSTNGKIDRANLTALPPTASGGLDGFAAPRDKTEAQLAELWARALGTKRISINADFFDEGGHSLLAVRLLAQIEKVFGQKMSIASLIQAPTIQAFAARLRVEMENQAEARPERVIPIEPEASQPPFFIVDGGPRFRPLDRRLGRDQPVFALALPAVTSLPERYTVENVAADLVEAMCELQPHGPYALGGWSMAGVFAYEMAQQLRSRGEDVAVLVLFDTSNPCYLRSFKTLRALPVRTYLFWQRLVYHCCRVFQVPPGEAMRYILERARTVLLFWQLIALKGVYGAMNRPGSERFKRVGGGPYLAVEDYEPRPSSAPVVLFRSTVLQSGRFHDPSLGWSELTRNLVMYEMPGEHDAMFHEPDVEVLAGRLNEYLSRRPGFPVGIGFATAAGR